MILVAKLMVYNYSNRSVNVSCLWDRPIFLIIFMLFKPPFMADLILSKESALRKLQRMAYEIIERNGDEPELILAGIRQSGSVIAGILIDFLKPLYAGKIHLLEVIINKKNPQQCAVESVSGKAYPDFNGKAIILVDDVSNSGRTLLYATRPFLEYYPKKIQTLVLVERSHKEFAISPDYTGMSVSTALSERIIVETKGKEVMGARLEVKEV